MSAAHGSMPEPRPRLEPTSKQAVHDDYTLLEPLPAAVLVLDSRGSVLFLNPAAERRLDCSAREVLGRALFGEVLAHADARDIADRYRNAMDGDAVVLDWDTTLPSGGAVRVAIRSLWRQEQRFGLVTIIDAEPTGPNGSRELLEHLAVVGELAGGVAHQINNPLASIKGFAQLLARETPSAEERGALEIIDRECARITRVVEDLLQFARPDQLGVRRTIDLNTLIEQTLALHEYSLTTSGIAVERDLTPDLSPVLAEPSALQRVLLALFFRAERALGTHGGARTITLRTRESTSGVVLCVQDTGPGLTRDELSTLFQAGESVPAAGCLGLDAAARLVARLRGEIWAETAPGRGTDVYVRLVRATSVAEPAAPTRSLQREPQAEARRRAMSRRLRILVADDEPMLHLALTSYMERYGHQVFSADAVDSALALAAEHHFDVALVDVHMPGDGRVLLEQLEEMPGLRYRTIVMSGDPRQARISSEHLDRPFLAKPFDMSQALDLIEAVGL